MEVMPGEEFRVAVQEAAKVGASVTLAVGRLEMAFVTQTATQLEMFLQSSCML